MSEPPPPPTLDEIFRDYAWDYFAVHADQRLKAFHFYILLSTAIIGAFGLLVRNGEFHKWMALFGFLLVFFSFVFWKLDNRTRQLVKNGEAALRFLDAQHDLPDQDGVPHPLRLFDREQALSAKLPLFPLLYAHFTYARCFRWVFLMFSVVGLGASLACLVLAQV
jgi:hypothetical protein